MMETTAKSAGHVVLRILAVVAIVAGILFVMVGLTQPNITGLILGVLLVGGAGFWLSRSRRR